jgi:hypothetical protein
LPQHREDVTASLRIAAMSAPSASLIRGTFSVTSRL